MGAKRLYDWGKWFGRERLILRPGRDYQCSRASFVQQLRNAAAARGVSIHIARTNGDSVVVAVDKGSNGHARVG